MSIKIGIGIILCKEMGQSGIERLRIQELFDSKSYMVPRGDVVEDIEKNRSHYHPLFTPAGSDSPEIGPKVHVVTVGKNKYLRTDPDNTSDDNLGELPDCS